MGGAGVTALEHLTWLVGGFVLASALWGACGFWLLCRGGPYRCGLCRGKLAWKKPWYR